MSSPVVRADGALTSTADVVLLGMPGQGGVSIQVYGTWTGTIAFDGATDGVTFQALATTTLNAVTTGTTTTANGIFQASCAGLTAVRARFSAYSNGTAMVRIQAIDAPPAWVSSGGGGGGGTVDQGTGGSSAWLVTGTGGDFPVSGTVAATQSGTWTVQPGNTANTTAWKVDGSAVTQPVSATNLDIRDLTSASDSVAVLQATASNLNATVVGTGTFAVQATVATGKTIKSLSGTFTADTDIVAAVSSKRIKVIGYAFFTFGTSATTVSLKSNGTGGTLLWAVCLQAATSTVMGANLAVAAPSFIFATAAGEKLTADTNTGDTVTWSVSYYDDDAA